MAQLRHTALCDVARCHRYHVWFFWRPTDLPSYISSPICFVATPKHKKHLVKDDGSSQNLKVHTLSRPCWQFWGRGSHRPKCRLFKQRYFYRDPKPKKDFCILLKLDPLHISCVIPSLPHLTPVIMINKILENISCQIVPIKSPFTWNYPNHLNQWSNYFLLILISCYQPIHSLALRKQSEVK